MVRKTKRLTISGIISIICLLAILIYSIINYNKEGYLFIINLLNIVLASSAILLAIISLFKGWDIMYITYNKNKKITIPTIEDAKNSLISHIKGFSSWTEKYPKEKELNKILQDSIKNIEYAVASAEDAVKSYSEKQKNN